MIGSKVRYWVKCPGYWFEGIVTRSNPPYGYIVVGFDSGGFPIQFSLHPGEFRVVEAGR
jgi:hypothetical protein